MTLIRELGSLESAGLIRVAQAEPELEYLFRHTLVQDAAYASLLGEDRKRLHRLVGETIEEMYPHRSDELASRLARHFDEAEECEKAMHYYRVAGIAALSSFASREAEINFRHAISLQEEGLEKADTLKSLGVALYQQGRLTEAIETLWEGIEISKAAGPTGYDLTAKLYSRVARLTWMIGDTPGGLEICEEGMTYIEGMEETKGFARLLHETARAYHFNGMSAKALPLCKQAIQIAERIDTPGVLADALATYGILTEPSTDEKIQALNRAVEIAEANGILHVAHRAHHNLGAMIAILFGDGRKAYEHYMRGAEISQERGVEDDVLYSLAQAYYLRLNFGDIQAVEEALPDFESRIKRLPDRNIEEQNLRGMKAALEMSKGSWQKAAGYLETAIKESRRQGDLQYLRAYLMSRGWLHYEIGLWERQLVPQKVIEGVKEAIQIDERLWGKSLEGSTLLTQIFTLHGDLEQAHEWLQSGWVAGSESENLSDKATLETAAGLLAKTEERWDEALSFFESAAMKRAKFGQKLMWAGVLNHWSDAHLARGEHGDLQRAQALSRESHQLLLETGSPGYIKLSESKLNAVRELIAQQVEAGEQAVEDIARAKEIQQSFMPDAIPEVSSMNITAVSLPARQISGDFYDFISLPDGKLGIVIADVADKGPAAALYMTSSRTLIRTYAAEYPEKPELVMESVNTRILGETHEGLFVSAFYGVLDPGTKAFTYCNAGHNPPLWFKRLGALEILSRTGLPLGIYEDVIWEQKRITLNPEDVLVLYTDGVTDGQNPEGDFYADERLRAAARSSLERSAAEIHASIMSDLKDFTQDTPQFDDLTLILLKCESEE